MKRFNLKRPRARFLFNFKNLSGKFSHLPNHLIRRIIESIAITALVAGFCLMAYLILSGNWQIRPILSGSMEPGFSLGGVAVTQRIPISQLKVGQVAVFHPPFLNNTTYIHRVISLSHSGHKIIITTKGDANTTPDPWVLTITSKYAYVARFTLPLVGYAAVWVHSQTGREDLLLVAIGLTIILVCSIALEINDKRQKKYQLIKNNTVKEKPKKSKKK